MASQKLYAGAKLRELRTKLGLTQKDFATRLGVSLPYLNQMENNNRPVSTTVVLALATEFGMDVTELSAGDGERLVSDMREALADPPTRPGWRGPFLTCTKATARPMNGLPRWMRPWAVKMPARPPHPGKKCVISFTIATIT
jgi:transcriptional regulator with XRE-family HTH domain